MGRVPPWYGPPSSDEKFPMLRSLLLAVLVLLSACETTSPAACCEGSEPSAIGLFVDTNDDGLPDRHIAALASFVDTDDDGLPDARPAAGTPPDAARATQELSRAYQGVLIAESDSQRRLALAKLARAVAEAQLALESAR